MPLERLPLLSAIALSTLPLLAQAESRAVGGIEVNDKLISVSGNGHERSFACNGRRLEVMGSDHVITTTGECAHVDISGAGNTVTTTIRSNGTLEVAGTQHKVNWTSPGDIKQELSGYDHKITRIK